MSSYTLTRSGLTQSLAAWGIPFDSLVLQYLSMQPDECSFEVRGEDVLAAPTFAYGDPITLSRDGTPIFIGTIRRLPAAASATEENTRYTAYNCWWELDQLIYFQYRLFSPGPTLPGLFYQPTTQLVLGQAADGSPISTAAQIAALVAFAASQGVATSATTSFTPVNPPFEEARDLTVAAAIIRMAAWTPDLVCTVTYATGTPVLNFIRRESMTAATVDLLAATALESWRIESRPDLVPAGVVLNFITSTENEETGAVLRSMTTQTAGTASGLGVVRATLTLGTGEEAPASLAALYYAALATLCYEGELRFKARDVPGTLRPGHKLNFTNGRAAWATAEAIVQAVTEIPGTGETTVAFGLPATISLDDLAAITRRVKAVQATPPSGEAAGRTEDAAAAEHNEVDPPDPAGPPPAPEAPAINPPPSGTPGSTAGQSAPPAQFVTIDLQYCRNGSETRIARVVGFDAGAAP